MKRVQLTSPTLSRISHPPDQRNPQIATMKQRELQPDCQGCQNHLSFIGNSIYVSAKENICQKNNKRLQTQTHNRKKLQRPAHPTNKEYKQFDLLSKNRDKNFVSNMSIKIFTERTKHETCEMELWWNHNHSVNCFHLQSFCPILPST